MKKALTILLALLLVCLLLPVQAADNSKSISFTGSTTGSDSIAVTGVLTTSTESGGTVYSVDLSWGSMAFEYQQTVQTVWDPTILQDREVKTGQWVVPDGTDSATGLAANQIHIKNRSNAEITYEMAFSADENCPAVTGALSAVRNQLILNFSTPVNLNWQETPNTRYVEETVTLDLSGQIPDDLTQQNFDVGTVTVTVNPKQDG